MMISQRIFLFQGLILRFHDKKKLRVYPHTPGRRFVRVFINSEMMFFLWWFGDAWGMLANHLGYLDFSAHGRAVILVDCR